MDPFEKLNAALDAHEERANATRIAAENKQTAEEQFKAEFANFLSMVAHPIFEQVGNHIALRGHSFRIENIDRNDSNANRQIGMTLHVYQDGKHERDDYSGLHHPQFSIFADLQRQNAWFHSVVMSPGGGAQSGADGAPSTLQSLTPDVLRAKVVNSIAKSFG